MSQSKCIGVIGATERIAAIDGGHEPTVEAVVSRTHGRRGVDQPALQLTRDGRANIERLSRGGMRELESRSVQHQPRGRFAAVKPIAGDRPAHLCQLNAELMGATGLWMKLEHRPAAIPFDDAIACDGAARLAVRRTRPVQRIALATAFPTI